jgi:hypothetical protein
MAEELLANATSGIAESDEGGFLLPFVAAAACGAAAVSYARSASSGTRAGDAAGGGDPRAGAPSTMMYDWSQRQTAWGPTPLDMKRELGAVAWSAADPFKLLVGSAEDDPRNQVSVVERRDGRLVTVATAEHRYQPAKVMFVPGHERVFATASDTVYLWDQNKRAVDEGGRTKLRSPYESAATFADFEQTLEPLALPPQWPTGKYCAPIVGFDIVETGLVAAHCDGRCMVWDLNVAAAAGRKDPPLLDHTVDSTSQALYDLVCAPVTSDLVGHFAACGAGGVFLYDARSRGCGVRPSVQLSPDLLLSATMCTHRARTPASTKPPRLRRLVARLPDLQARDAAAGDSAPRHLPQDGLECGE